MGTNLIPSSTKVFGWVADYSGCGYYRLIRPFQELEQKGYWAKIDTSLTSELMLETDLVVAQRTCTEHALEGIKMALRLGKRLVYEIDDDLLATVAANYDAHRFYGRPEAQAIIREAISLCERVTTTTPRLAQTLLEHYGASSVTVLPNCLPDVAYADPVHRDGTEPLVIGWAGGTSHAADCGKVNYPIRKLFQRNKNLTFHAAGYDCRKDMGIRNVGKWLGWAPKVERYYPLLDGIHIGLAPLENNRFNENKSPIKALEYGARGIPVVASDVGPYSDYVEHGVTGFLCRTNQEWTEALNILINDEAVRFEMAENARKKADQFRIADRWVEWADFYNCN